MNVVHFVVCVLVNLAAAQDTYRAAIVRDVGRSDLHAYIPAIHEAGRKNVDILVLPSVEISDSEYNYDESVKNIAKAARESRVYVAAHVARAARAARAARGRMRTSLVFNRDGALIALYRKPVSSNYTSEEINTFSTDFNVEFTLVMEEDLALQDPAVLRTRPTRNLLVTGAWPIEIPFLTASHLSGAWSYVSKTNVITSDAIHGAAARGAGDLVIADVNRNGRIGVLPPPVVSRSALVPGEDLSQFIIKPVDTDASAAGYTETVCHHKFCCQFYVKASFKGSKTSNFGLAAYEGVRHFDNNKYIGTQTCAMYACAGLYKRSCDLGSQNIIFERISISSNITGAAFPMIISSDVIAASQFTSDVINKQTTLTIHDSSLITFGIFGRDFTRDHQTLPEKHFHSESLFNENVQEFIDYVWIRLRILIFVVSIYILEMM